jgi:mono/diheme cytochrome c family protein
MDARARNQMMAQADRQLVFRGECANCHKPAPSVMGEQLFTSTCGICHESDHRATTVPDLHALKQTPNDAYWEAWIRYGKTGTMMPAFAMEHGGPLTDPQINSLVAYLSKDFPNRPPKGSVTAEPVHPVVIPRAPQFPRPTTAVLPPPAPLAPPAN